ncbi:MAG: hypothetical protein HQK53_15040 [Oligoflexia bacterium]|nr:hypothetical protein [Oligoflexia bacterium]
MSSSKGLASFGLTSFGLTSFGLNSLGGFVGSGSLCAKDSVVCIFWYSCCKSWYFSNSSLY